MIFFFPPSILYEPSLIYKPLFLFSVLLLFPFDCLIGGVLFVSKTFFWMNHFIQFFHNGKKKKIALQQKNEWLFYACNLDHINWFSYCKD